MTLLTAILGLAGIISCIMAFLILINKEVDYRVGFVWSRALINGVLLMIGVTVANSIIEKRWSNDYILGFLSLEEVGGWLFRIIAALAYLLIIVGGVSWLAFRLKLIIKSKGRNIT